MPYANFTAVSSTEPELLPIEVLHCGNSGFRVFLRKIVEILKFFVRTAQVHDADDAETHFLVHYRQFQLVCCRSYTHLRCYFTPNQFMWSLPVTWQTKMAVTPFDPQLPKTPCYTQTLRVYLLQNRSYCPLIFLHRGNREFRVFLRNIMENIIFPICVAKLMQIMPKHIFWPIIDYSSLYAAGVTRIVLRWIG